MAHYNEEWVEFQMPFEIWNEIMAILFYHSNIELPKCLIFKCVRNLNVRYWSPTLLLYLCSTDTTKILNFDIFQIIFCPYNYLVEPLIRKSMEINLKGQVRNRFFNISVNLNTVTWSMSRRNNKRDDHGKKSFIYKTV